LSDRNSEESASGADRVGASQTDHWAAKAARHNDAGRDDYEVGYGRPPKATRFQPGRSGNPAGGRKRKASDKSLLDRFEELLAEPVEGTVNGHRTRMDTLSAYLRHVRADAFKGKHQASKQFFEMIKELDARNRAAASIFANPNGKAPEFHWDEAQERLYRRLEKSCGEQNEE
jgi:hypothetical protein